MQISVTFLDNPPVQDSLRVDKLIGQGKFQVFRAYCASRKTNYALKIFPSDRYGMTFYLKERKCSNLSHPNLIERIPITCHDSDYYGQLSELAKFGDFFDAVQDGLFSNNRVVMRTYFHQLIKGVEYMHSEGFAHMDLKLENLMLGNNFQLKIIDFDSSQSLKSKATISRGSKDYRAPELINGDCADFTAADVYSLGIILYIFKTGEFPFIEEKQGEVNPKSSAFKFRSDKQDFWSEKAHRYRESTFFSSEFIELIDGMLERDPQKRFNIQDIKNTRWFKGTTVGEEELRKIMKPKWKEASAKKENPGTSLYC